MTTEIWKINKVKKPVYVGYSETYYHIVRDTTVLCSLREWNLKEAKKIAAAPDLLEACQGLLENAMDLAAAFDEPESEVAPFIVIAANAIKKATR